TTGDWSRVRWHRAIPDESPGEIFITLRPGNLFGPAKSTTTHGSPSDLDASVTLVLQGAAFRAAHLSQRVSAVDIAPTLARILGVTPDSAVQGRVLVEAPREV